MSYVQERTFVPSGFDDLPEETLVEIFSRLFAAQPMYLPGKSAPGPIYYPDLFNLWNVNRKCRRIAQEVLYTHVDLSHDPKVALFHTLDMLLDLDVAEVLGRKAQYLRLLVTEDMANTARIAPLLADLEGYLLACVKMADIPRDVNFERMQELALVRTQPLAWTSVLFFHLPNLRTLDIGSSGESFTAFTDVANRLDRARTLGWLDKVHTLTLRSHPAGDVVVELLQRNRKDFLKLPALRTLELVCDLDSDQWGPRDCSCCRRAIPYDDPDLVKYSDIENLTIRGWCDGWFQKASLDMLLPRFPSLTTLTIILHLNRDVRGEIQDIFESLLPCVTRTLTTLVVRCKAHSCSLTEVDKYQV
jgi:hypothetical protein